MEDKGANDPGKLIVLGLSWDTTDESLKTYMQQFGALKEWMVMRDRMTGRSRGFGFVTFEDPNVVTEVLQKKHYIDGREVEPKLATPRGEGKPANEPKSGRVFLAKLPFEVTIEEVRTYFEKYGELSDCYMPKDFHTGRNKGFGFVSFTDPASVDKVLADAPHEMLGRQVVVDRAEPDNKHGGGRGFGRGGGFSGAGRGAGAYPGYHGGYAGYYEGYGYVAPPPPPPMMYGYGARDMAHGYPPHHRPPVAHAPHAVGRLGDGVPSNKIFVAQLSFEATAADLRAYFEQFGAVEDTFVPKDRATGKPRGFGFVTFASPASVEQVVAAENNHVIAGRKVTIDVADPKGQAPAAHGDYRAAAAVPPAFPAAPGSGEQPQPGLADQPAYPYATPSASMYSSAYAQQGADASVYAYAQPGSYQPVRGHHTPSNSFSPY